MRASGAGDGPGTRSSPVAVALTVLAIGFAVVVGATGPRLRERQGSIQQDLPVGELAAAAMLHEARSAQDIRAGRSRAAALDRMDALAMDTLGRPMPDLGDAGFIPEDARIVELAPDLHALMVVYRSDASADVASVAIVPDEGRIVRLDGFGRALPLAPGDEWEESVADDRERGRVAWAVSDGRLLHLVLAPDRAALVRIAPLAVR